MPLRVGKLAKLVCLVMGMRVPTDKVKLNTRGERNKCQFTQIYVSI